VSVGSVQAGGKVNRQTGWYSKTLPWGKILNSTGTAAVDDQLFEAAWAEGRQMGSRPIIAQPIYRKRMVEDGEVRDPTEERSLTPPVRMASRQKDRVVERSENAECVASPVVDMGRLRRTPRL
jgi:hypothetical protein